MGKISQEYAACLQRDAITHVGTLAAVSAQTLRANTEQAGATEYYDDERGISITALQPLETMQIGGRPMSAEAILTDTHLLSDHEEPVYSRVAVCGMFGEDWEENGRAVFTSDGKVAGDIVGLDTYGGEIPEVRKNKNEYDSLQAEVEDYATVYLSVLATAQAGANVVEALVRNGEARSNATAELRRHIALGVPIMQRCAELVNPASNIDIIEDVLSLSELPNHFFVNPLPLK